MNLKSLILNLLLICVVATMLFCAATVNAASWQWIDGPQLQNRLKEGSNLWLIDVRSAAEYEAVHIEGSVNIPVDALAHKKFSAQKMLVLVDDALGQRSAWTAADALVKQGQERVSVLEGGIAAWSSEGLPLIEKKTSIRGVTADELKWALARSVQFKVYDLRDVKEQEKGKVQNGEPVNGKTINDRIDNLKKSLSNTANNKDLAAKMKKPRPVVLVFNAADDAEEYTRAILQVVQGDIRYLIGGYEAMVSDKIRGKQTTGSCPTCPGSAK